MSFLELAERASHIAKKSFGELSIEEKAELKSLEAKLVTEFGKIRPEALNHALMKEWLTNTFVVFSRVQMKTFCNRILSSCDFNRKVEISMFQAGGHGESVAEPGVTHCSLYHILLMAGCDEQYLIDILPTIVDLTSTDEHNRTCLIKACERGREELAMRMLATGRCDYKTANRSGYTPFVIACNRGLAKVVSHFVEVLHEKVDCSEAPVPLLEAIHGEQFTTVKYLVEHKANVNFKTRCGMTSLMISCQYKSIDAESIGLYLIDRGATVKDVAARYMETASGSHVEYHMNAMVLASMSKHEKLVKRLHQMGCTLDDADRKSLALTSEHKDETPVDPCVAKVRKDVKEFHDQVVSGLSTASVPQPSGGV